MKIDSLIFKSYDIRGIYGKNLFDDTAEAIGRAFSVVVRPVSVVVGRDCRLSSDNLYQYLIKGLIESGVNVVDIGLVSTDMYYYACATKELPGLMITASHNPKEYNGFKMVRKIPYLLSSEDGILEMKKIIENENFIETSSRGKLEYWNVIEEFVEKILMLTDYKKFKRMRILADFANGMAGIPLIKIFSNISNVELVPMYSKPDGNFPNHGGDPLQDENRIELRDRVVKEKFDLGFAFDTDGDRFFCLDSKGRFIYGDFMTAILSMYFLNKFPKSSIIYDVRASLVVKEVVERFGGIAIYNRVGHSYIKKRMNNEGAVFGGEITGHYYFKDFYYCDSGIAPVMYLLDFLASSELTLDKIVDQFNQKYFISGEINSRVGNVNLTFDKIRAKYLGMAENIIEVDGITLEFSDWRFNIRASNTEPLLRLNLEAKSRGLMEERRDELLELINGQ